MNLSTKTRLLAVTALAATPAMSVAALDLQSDSPTYTIDASGATTATVHIYLVQTLGTTILTNEGGLNSAGFVVTTSGGSKPTLTSIAPNPEFTGTKSPDTAAGTLYEEMTDLISGTTVSANRVFLGTYNYVGYAGVSPSTTFTIADRPGFDGFYTVAGTLLDASITSGTFTVDVTKPAALAFVALAAPALLRRRRH